MDSTPFIVFAVIVFSFVSSAVGFSFVLRSIRLRRERARAFAERTGLAYAEGWDVLKREYDDSGISAQLSMLERMPAFFRALLGAAAPWRIEGSLEGVKVSVNEETRSTGKNSSTTYLICKAYFPEPFPFRFRAARETTAVKIGKALFNLKDVQTGEREFDDAIRLVSEDENAARELFGRLPVRDTMVSAIAARPKLAVIERWAVVERVGAKLDEAETLDSLTILANLVRAISGES